MRGAYTAGIVTTLLEAGIYANYVVGISAGSSNTANYLSRQADRTRKCFVEFATDPEFGSWRSWLMGQGLFNARYIYEIACLRGQAIPYDFATFAANPADFRIGAYDARLGETVYWGRKDIHSQHDLMRKVRASSSIPIVMPSVTINGRVYVDGAIGTGGGIPLQQAQRDGYKKFFVVLTREREYVKPPYKAELMLRAYYRHYPAIIDGIMRRTAEYNSTRDELFELERAGQACLVMPNRITVTNRTRNLASLEATYDDARAQAKRELPHWQEFFGLR